MNRKRGTLGQVALVVVIGAGACGGSPPPPEPAPAPPPQAAAPPPARPVTTASTDGAEEARRELARKRAVLEEMVFFDYDQSTIRDDAKRLLDAKVAILRAEPGIRIQIAGHADERGSTEYNLALGSRRANQIRDYLTGFGLAENRFQVTTYGEGRPLVQGSSEASWARNRRGEFVIQAGLATNQ
jgi:peptidoglycan-associated lipoprotein